MPKYLGDVGEQFFDPGVKCATSLGNTGEVHTSQLHGKYFEQQLNETMFLQSFDTTFVYEQDGDRQMSDCALVNPAGSGVMLIPVRYELVFTALPTGPAVGEYFVGVFSKLSANGITNATLTRTTLVTLPVGCKKNSSCALLGSISSWGTSQFPTRVYTLGTQLTGAATTFPYMRPFTIEFDSSFIIFPDNLISFGMRGNSTTTPELTGVWVWIEIPVPAVELITSASGTV